MFMMRIIHETYSKCVRNLFPKYINRGGEQYYIRKDNNVIAGHCQILDEYPPLGFEQFASFCVDDSFDDPVRGSLICRLHTE